MSPARIPTIWTLTDNRAGNLNQAQALAQAIGAVDRHVSLQFPAPWRWLAPRGVFGALPHLSLPTDASWPDVAIGCGRQAALALRAMKHHRRTFTVQILDPRVETHLFDLVAAPAHDPVRGTNVLTTTGALNAIGEDWLEKARRECAELAFLPRPLIGVLIGGPHRDAPLSEAALESLLEQIARQIAASGGSFLVCGSRRTPREWRPMLRARTLQLGGRVWLDEDDGANLYRACLAHADRLVVSADSVNMLSEACAVGVPVTSFSAGALSGKLARFDATLQRALLLSPLDQPAPPVAPLREAAALAQAVLQRWRESTGD
ncbi:MAG: mitochondrial fission ELM1 family protein [Pseudomonadota bacterium]|nr:mitochondrial fission ELM1 family protein [Pseudomonadota bacterium]